MEPESAANQSKEYDGVSYRIILVGPSTLMSSGFTPDQCKQWNELTPTLWEDSPASE